MKRAITLLGEQVTLEVDQSSFYENMLKAIVQRVLTLLGSEFDKQAFLEEVEKGRSAVNIGQGWALPVSIMLSLELGYCLGQLKSLGQPLDSDQALRDLYETWKKRLKTLLREETITRTRLH